MSLRLSATPEELRKQFLSLSSLQDVASLLDIDLERLKYHIYIVPAEARYTTFQIPKKAGGTRTIAAPATALKIIQQKLNQVLLSVYAAKPSVHSFLPKRSILSNARVHSGRRNILNVDLKDFYPSINFGRVRGMFIGTPYKRDPSAATVLAQICCFNNQLPQGAPTSPIVSNMICAKMDSQLQALARDNRCNYTRYADDITFSSNLRDFPSGLGTTDELGQAEVGYRLAQIIEENGFQVNPDKVRLRNRNNRQQVTGLITNKFPNVRRKYVRQVRAMLHAWEKYGLESAEEEFLKRYYRKHRNPDKSPPVFRRVVKGKIDFLGMVRGKRDHIYLGLLNQLGDLDPDVAIADTTSAAIGPTLPTPRVMAEGKTDYQHLRTALAKLKKMNLYTNLEVDFGEPQGDMGEGELLRTCKIMRKWFHEQHLICIFDRDRQETVKQVSSADGGYKAWDNNVFSFAIPVPDHRKDTPGISIELYYTDEEVKRTDKSGRRLYLSTEFHDHSGRHYDPSLNLNCTDDKYRHSKLSAIDNHVYNNKNVNVALPKADFARYVADGEKGFDDFDFSEFRRIFDVIVAILVSSK